MLTAPQGSDLPEYSSPGMSSLDRGAPCAEPSRGFQPGLLCPPTARHPSSGAGAIPHDAARIAPAQPGALRPRTRPGARTQPGPSTAEPRAVPPGSTPHGGSDSNGVADREQAYPPQTRCSAPTRHFPDPSSFLSGIKLSGFSTQFGKPHEAPSRTTRPPPIRRGAGRSPLLPHSPASRRCSPAPGCSLRAAPGEPGRSGHHMAPAGPTHRPPPCPFPSPSSFSSSHPSVFPSLPLSPFTLLPPLKPPFLHPSFILSIPPCFPSPPHSPPRFLSSLLSPSLPPLSPLSLTPSLSLHSFLLPTFSLSHPFPPSPLPHPLPTCLGPGCATWDTSHLGAGKGKSVRSHRSQTSSGLRTRSRQGGLEGTKPAHWRKPAWQD